MGDVIATRTIMELFVNVLYVKVYATVMVNVTAMALALALPDIMLLDFVDVL
jgi:hypothetical protein